MKQLWVTAAYIPSRGNYESDIASRQTNIDTEWEIAKDDFGKIITNLIPFRSIYLPQGLTRNAHDIIRDFRILQLYLLMHLQFPGIRKNSMLSLSLQ